MSRLSLFNSPLVLGFDHFERVIDRVSRASGDGYPPYNVEQTGPQALRITLAVAGFKRDELTATIEDNELGVRGKQVDEEGRVYLHRGIAARQFQRRFVLADGIEITAATLGDGLLHIDLVRPVVEPRTRTIDIHDGESGGGPTAEAANGSIRVENSPAAAGAARSRTRERPEP
jgi:HSP20 family molecular chaperone IbpA